MRTFIIRARKASTQWRKLRSQLGNKDHIEVVAHCVMNAFLISNDFRKDVVVYIVLDSSEDFPRTIQLTGSEGLSLAGFHEEALLSLIEQALKNSQDLGKNEHRSLMPGVSIHGFGFERLLASFSDKQICYMLTPKGDDIREVKLAENPVFILSDHLAMPKKTVKSLLRQGINALSLGKKMLFASQCVVLIHHELDRLE